MYVAQDLWGMRFSGLGRRPEAVSDAAWVARR
jgi:hypothetical protein